MVMNVDGWDDNPPAEGYCEHGKYVGGCGYDLMCGWCEEGVSAAEVAQIHRNRVRREALDFVSFADRLITSFSQNLSRQQFLNTIGHLIEYFDEEGLRHYLWCLGNKEWPDDPVIVLA